MLSQLYFLYTYLRAYVLGTQIERGHSWKVRCGGWSLLFMTCIMQQRSNSSSSGSDGLAERCISCEYVLISWELTTVPSYDDLLVSGDIVDVHQVSMSTLYTHVSFLVWFVCVVLFFCVGKICHRLTHCIHTRREYLWYHITRHTTSFHFRVVHSRCRISSSLSYSYGHVVLTHGHSGVRSVLDAVLDICGHKHTNKCERKQHTWCIWYYII